MVAMQAYFERVERVRLHSEDVCQTQQHKRGECNINEIMEKALKSGLKPRAINPQSPLYGDFSMISDFQTAQNKIIQAAEEFNMLPAKIREKFGNKPENLVMALNDPEQTDWLIELGLLEEKAIEAGSDEGVSTDTPKKKVAKKAVKAAVEQKKEVGEAGAEGEPQ